MSKKFWSVLAAGALIASVFTALPAKAAPEVPAEVQIEDPVGDGNFLNDQGFRGDIGFQGNNVTPADGSTVGDLMKVWFTNDAENITIHYQTERPGPAATSILYQTYSNVGEGSVGSSAVGCLRWVTLVPGVFSGQRTTYQGEPVVKLVDRCNDGTNVFSNGVEGEFVIEEGPDQSGILSVTFPRSYSPLLEDGGSIVAPFAESRLAFGGETPAATTFNSTVTIDNTVDGTDYAISSGGDVISEPPVMEEPPKVDEPKKKNCSKIANKKKRQKCIKRNKKLSKPQGCATYEPGELGAEAETVIVKDDATEEAPVEVELEFGVGIPENPNQEHQQVNVQVDPKDGEAGLYVRFEFANYEDMDLWAYHASGDEAARAAGYNPAPVSVFDGTGNGGHSEQGAEQLDGIRTSKCGGYTIDTATFQNNSGVKTLKLWLGEIANDPK